MRTPTPIITLLTGAGLGLVLLIASTQATRTNASAGGGASPAPAATSDDSGSGSGDGGGSAAPLKPTGPLPAIPGCDAGIATAADLAKVEHATTTVQGRPFAVAVSPDGKWSFVTAGDSLAVLSNGSGLAPSVAHTLSVPGADKGLAVTGDGKYLVVAAGGGAKVLSATDAEQGRANLLGLLHAPQGGGAVAVAISPDNQFAYVTLQDSNGVAVFNLKHALSAGFDAGSYVGQVRTGPEPVGIALSGDPERKWLYVTNWGRSGTLSVLNRHLAETDPGKAVITKSPAPAGCDPSRILASSDGQWVWLTAQASNAVLGYDAVKLRTDPAHALATVVPVGENPIGMLALDHDRQLVVANSGSSHNLMVIDTHAALCRAGKKVTGSIAAGKGPRDLSLAAGGGTLLVTNLGAAVLEAVRVDGIPAASQASSCG
jgi:DNA-binding beta-propeller fold protein YncE